MSGFALPAALAGTALGILLEDGGWLADPPHVALAAVGVLLSLAGGALRSAAAAVLGVLLLGLAIGGWRGADAALPLGPNSLVARIGSAAVDIDGRVSEEPRPRGERQQVVLDDVRVAPAGGPHSAAPGRLLVWLPRSVAPGAGDRIRFAGRLQAPRDFDGFAYREYLARQGIGAVSSAYRVEITAGSRGPVAHVLASARAALLAGLNAVVPEPEAALGVGILLGVRAGIAPEVDEAFATAGLTHVVAISGWNIAIVAALVATATRPLLRLPGGRWLGVGVAVAVVGGYVLLTGASPSVVRAALMAGALVMARLGGSPAHALSALMVAAQAMLLAAPSLLWDVGFQLSALATAGLVWFAAPLETRLAGWPALVREPVALTLAAQLTTLPVIVLNFERLSLVAPAANVAVMPIVPIVMLCSALAALVGAIDGAMHVAMAGDLAVWAAGGAAWLYLRLMIIAGEVAASVPFASIELVAPAWLAAGWYSLLVHAHRRLRASPSRDPLQAMAAGWFARPLPAALVTLAVLGGLTVLSRPDGRLHLVMLDVGQGDAILVRGPSGMTMLVDGGPDPDLAARHLGGALPFWQRGIDVVVLSHPHEDHVAGLLPALERYRVGLVLEAGRAYDNPTYPRFLDLARTEPGGALQLARAGRRVELGPATTFTILFPSETDAAAELPEGDINNASVVGLLQHGSVRILLTGDAEAPVEQRLLARGLLGQVDVLKVGHHGSDSSSTQPFVAVVRPRIALISAGVDNEYGHPHAMTLDHIAAVPGVTVLRTDLHGSVELVVSGGAIEVRAGSDAGSIGPWPSPASSGRRRSSARSIFRRRSSPTPAAWRAWRPRPHGWWRRRACRWTWSSSRSPPCSTTSTRC